MKTVAIDGTTITAVLLHATTAFLEGMMDKDDPFYEICAALESGETVEVTLEGYTFTFTPSDIWD